MAFQGPPQTGHAMGHGMLPPPTGIYHPQHASFAPPPMMMGMHPVGQHMAPGMVAGAPPMLIPPMMMMPGPVQQSSEAVLKVPIPSSTANMKVATTVFVGNISEKASDTLIRQILLRCGPIDGWKRVQDATGKLQGFGFCEYADPDSTLRALRLLHNLGLGEKSLVAKVDAKTRKELLKYLITKKHQKNKGSVNEAEVDKEVAKLEEDKDAATAALITEVPEDEKADDNRVQGTITSLLKDYLSILSSSKSNEDMQRERDVKESILFMAKQSGSIDPDSTLEDMDMEDDMKTLVSDEIKRFRESYKRSDEARKDRKAREPERDRDEDRGRMKGRESEPGSDLPKERPKRERSRSPTITKRDGSPQRGPKSPVRSRSQERQEKEKRREAMRQRERADMLKEENEHEERIRQRRLREREKAYRQRLANWEGREYRKGKEQEKEAKREKDRREDMERERKHLGDFLSEYDDNKDDQKYYRGSAYARRRREREMEMDYDERDRMREKDELEELRLQVIERQAREILSEESDKEASGDESPSRPDEDEEDMDIPVKVELEDIPLTKSGYTVPGAFPPIQVHSAPSVDAPDTTGFHLVPPDHASPVVRSEAKQEQSQENNSPSSPSQNKLAFGLKKTGSTNQSQPLAVTAVQTAKLDRVFASEDDDVESKPKKKLVPIEYSDEEDEEDGYGRSPDGRKRRSHRSSGKGSSRRSSNHHGSEIGVVDRGFSLSSTEGLLEDIKDRKLTSDERKKVTQRLVNSIPTTKEEVFQYELKWDQIDKALIEKRVGPWINKKITEYIGEAEPILTEFICNKLSCHISPDDILSDISMVLDEEAEVFILKLWRLLIYETEAKHLGIAKSY